MSNDAVKLTKPIHKLEAVHIARSQSVQSPTRNDVAGSPPVQSPTTSSVRPQPGLRFSELWLLKSRHPAMVSCPVLAGSKVLPFGVFLPNGNAVSFRHCHKHLEDTFPAKNLHSNACFKLNKTHLSSSLSLQKPSERFSLLPLKCSSSHSTAKTDDGIMFRNSSVESIKSNFSELTPFLNSLRNHSVELIKSNFSQLTLFLESLKNLSAELIKSRFSYLTPFDLCKWSVVIAIAIAVPKWIANAVFNPFFWMYFSWSWLFWPWMAAIGIAAYGFYCLNKHLRGDANVFEQLAIVTSAFTWLTLMIPSGILHTLPNWQKLFFCSGVAFGHWIAAFEGPELHIIPGGWSSAGVWALIIVTLFMQYYFNQVKQLIVVNKLKFVDHKVTILPNRIINMMCINVVHLVIPHEKYTRKKHLMKRVLTKIKRNNK
nr:PEMT domain-containing protein [Ipomoea batatas]